MEEFKVNTRKVDACSEEIGDCEKKLREIREGVSSIRGNLRHKLSAIEGIGQTLMKIEGNLETETSMMSGLGSTLGTIADNYRHTERGIVDFGTGSISGGQLTDLQKDALRFEEMLGDGSEEWEWTEGPVYLAGNNDAAFFDDGKDIFIGAGDEGEWIAHVIDLVKYHMENGGNPVDAFFVALKEVAKEGISDKIGDWFIDKLPDWMKDPIGVLEDLRKAKQGDEIVFDI